MLDTVECCSLEGPGMPGILGVVGLVLFGLNGTKSSLLPEKNINNIFGVLLLSWVKDCSQNLKSHFKRFRQKMNHIS